jgi:serine/threonine protein kinase
VLPPQHQQRPQQQHQEIRAAHEMAGSSAGGGNADANAANPPAPHHPGFGPLDTTDPMLTTDAVVPYSQVLCDGDFHALYLLGERLGQGSYGTVHRCERRADGALFAVKVLALAGFRGEHRLPEIEDEVQLWRRVQDAHDSAVAEALAEAEAAGQVAASPAPSPPSPIVRLVSAHRDLTAAYLVQELCEGGDLQGVLDAQAAETIERAGLEARAAAGDEAAAQALAEAEASSSSSSARPGGFPGALPEPLAAAAMASALRFIAACHDAGVVFGDVKPSNFLLTLAEEEEEGEEQQGEGEAAAATTATATAPTTKPERRKRLLLRLRGADFGTALALPVDGVCSIHQGGCACADLAAFSLSTGGANNSRAPSRAGARSTSPAANEAVVAAAFAANGSGNSAGSPPAAPVYARECVPRRGLSGTPVYMAPELVRERRAGPAADVWAAGAMAYLLLTGRFPFWPDVDIADLARLPPARVLAEVAAAPLALEHPRATAHLSPEARGFLARLLERDPSRRVTARAALSHPFLAAAAREAAAPGGAAAAAQQAVVASR